MQKYPTKRRAYLERLGKNEQGDAKNLPAFLTSLLKKHKIYKGGGEMYNFFVDSVLWTFAIYGIICFFEDNWLDLFYGTIQVLKYFGKYMKNLLIKN